MPYYNIKMFEIECASINQTEHTKSKWGGGGGPKILKFFNVRIMKTSLKNLPTSLFVENFYYRQNK